MPLVIEDEWIERVRSEMPELPDARRARFVSAYGLPDYDAGVLTASKELADWFEVAVAAHPNAKALANWIMSDVIRIAIRRCGNFSVDLHAWGLFAFAAAISRKALKNFDFTVWLAPRSSIVSRALQTGAGQSRQAPRSGKYRPNRIGRASSERIAPA